MKKVVLIFISIISTLPVAMGQSLAKLFDTEGYQHTINYPDHKLRFFTLSADRAPGFTEVDKKYFWYSNNHISSTQGGFSGKLLHGLYSDFYLNKSLKEQGLFRFGLKEGLWKTWGEDGLLIALLRYHNGLLHGKYSRYNQTGELSEQGSYKRGKLDGKLKSFIKPDSVGIQVYKDGLLLPEKKKKGNALLKRFFNKTDKSTQKNTQNK